MTKEYKILKSLAYVFFLDGGAISKTEMVEYFVFDYPKESFEVKFPIRYGCNIFNF